MMDGLKCLRRVQECQECQEVELQSMLLLPPEYSVECVPSMKLFWFKNSNNERCILAMANRQDWMDW